MHAHPTCSSHRSGTALITALVLTLVVTAMAAAMSSLSVNELSQQDARWQATNLLLSAETGMNTAYLHMQENYLTMADAGGPLASNGDSTDIDLGTYATAGTDPSEVNSIENTCRVTRLSGTGPQDAVFLIQVTATRGSVADPSTYRRKRIEATFSPVQLEIFTQAMLAIEGYDFQGNAATSSWDSSAGVYTDGVTGSQGDLGSEGDITVLKPGNVNGDVNDNQEYSLPDFNYSDQLASAGATTLLNGGGVVNNAYIAGFPSNELVLTAADSPYRCRAIEMSGSHYLRIQGDVELFVDEHVQISPNNNDVAILYDAGASLRVYQGDYETGVESSWDNNGGGIGHFEDGTGTDTDGITITGGSGWTQETYPEHLLVMTEYDGQFKMNGNGTFSGVFFAPEATIQFNGTFDFFGSVIAQHFATGNNSGKVNGTFEFHYDENLANLSPNLTPRLVMLGWRSYDLGFND